MNSITSNVIAWTMNNRHPQTRALLSAAVLAAAACGPWTPAALGEPILLRGATVHVVAGQTLQSGDVLFDKGRIIAVGTNLVAEGARKVDLAGRHIYPGLISAGTVLGLLEISAVRATLDSTEVGLFRPDVQSWIAVNPDSELIAVARANGITHVLPVPLGGIVSGQSGLVALRGWTTEDMAVHKPAALHLFWPSMSLDTRPKEEWKTKWKSLEDQAVERQARLGDITRFFAEAKAYARNRAVRAEGPEAPEIVPAWEAMLPFVDGRIPLMVHANDLRQITSAVEWAVTNQFKIIVAGGRDAWMVAPLLATNQIPVLFEHVFTLPAQDNLAYDAYFRAPGILERAGVKVLLGEGLDESAATNLRNVPYAAAQAVAFGFSAEAALKSLTLHPAEVLGVAHRLGSLQAEREATIVVTTGDIFDLRSNVVSLWIAGEEVSLESRHTRLYQKYKNRPRP